MSRSYKFVEKLIHAWILQSEHQATGKSEESAPVAFFADDDANKPYLPLTPLHSTDLYWDTQFLSAS